MVPSNHTNWKARQSSPNSRFCPEQKYCSMHGVVPHCFLVRACAGFGNQAGLNKILKQNPPPPTAMGWHIPGQHLQECYANRSHRKPHWPHLRWTLKERWVLITFVFVVSWPVSPHPYPVSQVCVHWIFYSRDGMTEWRHGQESKWCTSVSFGTERLGYSFLECPIHLLLLEVWLRWSSSCGIQVFVQVICSWVP